MSGTTWGMNGQWILAGMIPASYVAGSVPFGLLVGLARGVDVRRAGSGNIGATNVGRLLGGRYFALVFVLDLLKSLGPMLAAGWTIRRFGLVEDWRIYLLWLGVGLAAVLGHMFSLFLKFKGGKGVATSAGMVLGLWPYYTLPAAAAVLVWVGVFLVWRYVSLASMAGAAVFPMAYVAIGLAAGWPVFSQQLPLLLASGGVGAMVILRHRANIARLRAGTEHRFSGKV
jgi:acyl phosphate:glycerol-3-phosphate acyltransferase